MKKILAFRTDRLGDFIITKQSLNILLKQKDKYIVDIVVSPKNYNYVRNFKSINKIYIFKNSYFNFFLKNYDILSNKYDYIVIYDGKKRSHLISFFLKGKKISLSKTKNLFFISKLFKYITVFNSNYTVQIENFNFVNLLLGEKNVSNKQDFYFDYNFKKLNLRLPLTQKKNFIFHLDEKWFKGYYYHDFHYCDWDKEFFYNLIKKVYNKYDLPIIVTTGLHEIPFLDQIKCDFIEIQKNIYQHKDKNKKLFLIDNLSFRELESLLKNYAKYLLCCEGGISHVSNNLHINTIALVQGNREIFYRHWTGHMNNVFLIKRGDQKHLLNKLSELDENLFPR